MSSRTSQQNVRRRVRSLEVTCGCITSHVDRRGLDGAQFQIKPLIHNPRRRVAASFRNISAVAGTSCIPQTRRCKSMVDKGRCLSGIDRANLEESPPQVGKGPFACGRPEITMPLVCNANTTQRASALIRIRAVRISFALGFGLWGGWRILC